VEMVLLKGQSNSFTIVPKPALREMAKPFDLYELNF
jgi:hypothetical protein